ncbi:MAG: cytochrome c [Steroidobacteraceae bacterium]|jgi:mono/diheme cytochrome c family protein
MSCRGLAAGLLLASAAAGAQETTSSALDGVYTLEQAARGVQIFAQHCAVCHGASLGGVGEAPALVGAQFIADFNGLTLGDLFERIRTTMPLNNPDGLSRDQYSDILAFVLKSNGFPAGARELYKRSEYLNVIRFEAPRQP